MKFSQNTPVVQPNTIGNVAVRVSGDPMAYGTGGKEYGALAGAIGQMAKVAKEQQDDMDAADVMEARNKIMGSLTESMYGEKGLLTNGIGENAKGLEGRVTDTVQKTFDSISKNYNIRVQRALRGNLSENMGNFQRIAAQQEGREYRKQKDSQYGITINNGVNMSMINYQDDNLLNSTINDLMNIVDYRAKDQGFSEIQRQQERRRVTTAVVSAAMQAAIDNGELDTASIYADRYGKYMEQGELMKYQKVLRQEKRLVDEKNIANEIIARHRRPDGTYDLQAIDEEIEKMAMETKTVGGGGSGVYSGDAQTDALIQKYAAKYNLPVDLFAALGDVESNFNQGAVSGVGAKGMYQLMHDTAVSLGVDPDTLEGNIEGGAKYLRQMLDTFGGNEDLAIAAYNAGPGAVKDAGNQIPNYAETQNHVKKVREARKKYRGGVSFEKLDSDIDASGVQIDGAQPQTIGMINYAKKVYKEMFGRDDFWVSSVTGGHDAGTPHALGYKADVGGSALKDVNNLKKYQQALQAAGIGCNDEYNYKSKGWTGPHLDLDSRGTNWQTGEEFGGFKGGGGGGRTVNAHDSGWADRVRKLARAKIADAETYMKDEKKQKLENYWKQIQGTSSAEEAMDILNRANASEDYQTANAVESMVQQKYKGIFNKGKSSTGSNKITGASGETYTPAQLRQAQRVMNRWYKAVDPNNPDEVSQSLQDKADEASYKLIDAGLYEGGADVEEQMETFSQMQATAREVWEKNQDYQATVDELVAMGWTETNAITTLDSLKDKN